MKTIDQDAQCPIHGCARHRCDEHHDDRGRLDAVFLDEGPAFEKLRLSSSSIACAVADAWCADRMNCRCAAIFDSHPTLALALDVLDLLTRESPLRKVKP